MKWLVVFVVIGLLITPGLSFADISTPQESMTISAEAGRSYSFVIPIQNSDDSNAEILIEAEGKVGDWVEFGDEKTSSYTILVPPFSTIYLPITITVPDSADTKESEIFIVADDEELMEIGVRVVPPMDEIISMEETASIALELNEMRLDIVDISNSIASDVLESNEDLSGKISEVGDQVQANSMLLQQEKRDLEEKIDSLDVLTGSATAGSSVVGFIVGVIVAIIIIALYNTRKRASGFKVKVRREKPAKLKETVEERPRYKYTPKD